MNLILRKLTLVIGLILFVFTTNAQIEHLVKWSFTAKRINGNEAILYMKANIERPWHIYSLNQPAGGPEKTFIRFKPSKDYLLVGKALEPKSIKKYEEVFGVNIFYFENTVTFQQRIKIKRTNILVKGTIGFMACTEEQCLPLDTTEFAIPIE